MSKHLGDDLKEQFINGKVNEEVLEKRIEERQNAKKKKLYVHMFLLMFSATTSIIVQTYQNEEKVGDPYTPGRQIEFNHPYF